MNDIKKALDSLKDQAQSFSDYVSSLTEHSTYSEVKGMVDSFKLLYERFRYLVD